MASCSVRQVRQNRVPVVFSAHIPQSQQERSFIGLQQRLFDYITRRYLPEFGLEEIHIAGLMSKHGAEGNTSTRCSPANRRLRTAIAACTSSAAPRLIISSATPSPWRKAWNTSSVKLAISAVAFWLPAGCLLESACLPG